MDDEYGPMRGQDPAQVARLLARTGVAAKMRHPELARHLGYSRRSISRWAQKGTHLGRSSVLTLIRLALPHDAALAEELAGLIGETLVSLRLVAPPVEAPAALAPAPFIAPPSKLADAVVCAAAEALDMSPRLVRPALLAALRAAREAGLGAETLEELLAARAP